MGFQNTSGSGIMGGSSGITGSDNETVSGYNLNPGGNLNQKRESQQVFDEIIDNESKMSAGKFSGYLSQLKGNNNGKK